MNFRARFSFRAVTGKLRGHGTPFLTLLTIAVLLPNPCRAGNDGLARTPPMGWNSWNCFHLDISDPIIRAEADAMVKTGMRQAGYRYIVIDGGWEGYHDT
ncbi:MAG: hypothetical protein ACRED1_05855, partial [Limisphaerales bacterium]